MVEVFALRVLVSVCGMSSKCHNERSPEGFVQMIKSKESVKSVKSREKRELDMRIT